MVRARRERAYQDLEEVRHSGPCCRFPVIVVVLVQNAVDATTPGDNVVPAVCKVSMAGWWPRGGDLRCARDLAVGQKMSKYSFDLWQI